MRKFLNKVYHEVFKTRFEAFFFSLLAVLFGSLIVPEAFFQNVLLPFLLLLNLISGVILVSKNKMLIWFFAVLAIIGISMFIHFQINTINPKFGQLQLVLYGLFYAFVTVDIIKQVWNAKEVNKNVIIGLMTGYLSLGLLAFFIFLSIETLNPDSFQGRLITNLSSEDRIDSLMYYSYITLLTIGYGEIIPVTAIAQKAAVLTGLIGQFYLVIITAVVVEKYVSYSKKQ